MVCIVHEKEGADIFQTDSWKGQVYFDESKGFYKALGYVADFILLLLRDTTSSFESIDQ